LNICSRVMTILNKVNFRFPQEHHFYFDSFCNETVYGKMNLIEVTGLFLAI
jgi:hypothetical protein